MKSNTLFRFIFVFLILFQSSCNVTKNLQDDDNLIVKYHVKGIDDKYAHKAKDFLKPKTNAKTFGLFKFNLWVYQTASKGRSTKFKNGLLTKVGEKPTLYSKTEQEINEKRIAAYLFDNGYFVNDISHSVTSKRKKAVVTFNVKAQAPYVVRWFNYPIGRSEIENKIRSYYINTLIKNGDNYSASKLDEERNNITAFLRDQGYLDFRKDLMYFDIDTTIGNNIVDIWLKLKEGKQGVYNTSKIGNIYIDLNYDGISNTNILESYSILLKDSMYQKQEFEYLRKNVFLNQLFFKSGDLYSESNLRLTQSRLNSLNVFSFVNIRLAPSSDTSSKAIDVFILLAPSKRRDFTVNAQGSTLSGTNLGVQTGFTYHNRNLRKGGEMFEFNVNGGVESQPVNSASGNNDFLLLFNTAQYGASASVYSPRLGFPFKSFNKQGYLSSNSRNSLNYFAQERPDYNRFLFSYSYNNTIKISENKQLYIVPFEVNLVRTTRISEELQKTLIDVNDPFLLFSFNSHLTTSSKVSYTINNLNKKTKRGLNYYNFGIESAGNIVDMLIRNFDKSQTVIPRKIFGLTYFHYLRLDFEFRKYFLLKGNNTIATRLFIGNGIPLANSTTLPLEKRYFMGGSNGLRAWQARGLGPGAYDSYQYNVDQYGDVKIEANIENRFKIIGPLQGAFFLDVGNIWLRKSPSGLAKDSTVFHVNNFYKQLGLGSGFGIRYDFQYFIMRTDFGLKIYDPALTQNDKWVVRNYFSNTWDKPTDYKFIRLNIGLGFPF